MLNQINDDYIKYLFIDKYKRNYGNFWRFCKTNIINYIINRYPDTVTKKESLYRIVNNINEKPICSICNKNTCKFVNSNKGYRDFCDCKKCITIHANNKMYETNIKKYGTKLPSQTQNVINKMHKTNLERYGVETVSQSKIIQEKIKINSLNKYGVSSTSKLENVKHKMKYTCIKIYGHTSSLWGPEQIKKSNETKIIKFGTIYPSQTNEVQDKIHNTLLKHKTYRTSKDEERMYTDLLTKFNATDIERQYIYDRYKNDLNNRKWRCDFYIKSLDLFIECNYSQYHHFHKYNKNTDKLEYNNIISKCSKTNKKNMYNTILYVWTDLDVRKLKCVETQKLNYKAFYNINEFNNWFTNI